MNNLLNKDGCKFIARIEEVQCIGRIYVVDNNVYLLQNVKNGGRPCPFLQNQTLNILGMQTRELRRIWSITMQKTLKSLKIVL